MKVLVTGGSGFIGTNLIDRLRREGHEILNVDPSPPRNAEQEAVWRRIDLLDAAGVRQAVEDFAPTHIAHLGARTDLNETKDLAGYAVNYDGTRNIIEAAKGVSTVERMLIASSRLVCEIGYQPKDDFDYQPTTLYGESKVLTEKVTRELDPPFSWCLLRFTSIWGPWFAVPYEDFFMAIARGRYIHPRDRRIHKSFGFVGNTVHQLIALLKADAADMHRQMFYIGDAPPLEVFEWAKLIAHELGTPPPREVPYSLLKAAAVAGDALRMAGVNRVPLTSFRLNNLLTEMVYDVAPIMKVAGPLPYSLADGVRQTVEWVKHHRRLGS